MGGNKKEMSKKSLSSRLEELQKGLAEKDKASSRFEIALEELRSDKRQLLTINENKEKEINRLSGTINTFKKNQKKKKRIDPNKKIKTKKMSSNPYRIGFKSSKMKKWI